jgi:hypothetical protein
MIKINLDKAKEIHKDNLRQAREEVFKDLDMQFIRAIEKGEDTTVIAQKKQELRDITKHPNLIGAKRPEEIKVFWPDILNK